MRTIELTIFTIGTGILYTSYLYYLLESGNDDIPTNLWYTLGSTIDEILFNSGVKPKQQIKNNPNRITEWINDNSEP